MRGEQACLVATSIFDDIFVPRHRLCYLSSSSMYLSKLLHVFAKVVAVVDRTRQQKSTLLSLDTDSVTTLAFMATSGGHQGGKRILFLGIVAHIHSVRIFFTT